MLRTVTLLALASLFATPAAAQLKPRVMVIFDTSGSMLWDPTGNDYGWPSGCWGDGSVTYPHRNPQCVEGSRMFHAKEALRSVIDARNVDVEFGLMRYGQLEPGDAGFGTDQSEVGAQYRAANQQILSTNYDGATNGCMPADLLVSPGPESNPGVLSWIDNQESYPSNKELRANGYTPLTASLDSARAELARQISQDPDARCRPYFVLLLTDGYQQCPSGDPGDLDRETVRQQLVSQVSGLRSMPVGGLNADVRTFIVGFGPNTAVSSELDSVARAAGTAVNASGELDLVNGVAYQANDPEGLVFALAAAVDNAHIQDLCNGLDDDCDGAVDEDYPRVGAPCEVGVGLCASTGTLVCNATGDGLICNAQPGDGRAEECNDLDDDCDGAVDEGVLNACGGCGALPDESCNGLDDDCDGAVDEGVLNACGGCGAVADESCNGQDDDCDGSVDEGVLNACGRCGVVPAEVCNCQDDDCDNQIDEGLSCPPNLCGECEPSTEVCNGQDDDCDNQIDEGVMNACGECGATPVEVCNGADDDCDGQVDESDPALGEPCGLDEGICVSGEQACEQGRLICRGATEAEMETCDAVDNDCDGEVDEGTYNACGFCGPLFTEVCDNIDNDCDGQDDEGELCRGDQQCVNGECAPPCQNNECFDGRVCVRGFCLDPCRNSDCPSGQVCQNGECRDPCGPEIPCPDGTYCTLGRCVAEDCNGPAGCPDGQYCDGGRCVDDQCAHASCTPHQGCEDGACFNDCSQVTCEAGLVCENGACVEDVCARVACAFPLICQGGSCVEDPCFEVDCATGTVCEGGACVQDPCSGVTCPSGACQRGVCVPEEDGLNPGTPDGGLGSQDSGLGENPGSTTGDSCACRAGTGSGGGLWSLALGLAFVVLRRRRR